MSDKQQKSGTIKPFIRLRNDAGTEDVYYSLFYEGIPNEFKDIARKELNETEENKRKGILKLREYLIREDISGVDEDILLSVLRNCKFNVENSKKKLVKFLPFYRSVIEKLQKADLTRLENVLNNRVLGILPYRDAHGKVILYTTSYDIDLDLFDMDDAALCGFCLGLYALNFPLSTIAGLTYIGDCKSPSLSVLYPALKAYRRHILASLNFPIRISKIDFLNENFLIRWCYNLMRPFVPTKILQRIQFHGSDIQNLQKFYHPAILPEEFGGTMGPLSPKYIKEDFFNFIKRLKSRH